jgi:hypothetical protein
MRLAAQWQRIERGLSDDWAEADLSLTIPNEQQRRRALALLGPANPGRFGNEIRFRSALRGAGPAPDHILRLLKRLDDQRIEGRLALVAATEAPRTTTQRRPALAGEWRSALAALPRDWSDLYAEVEVSSTDYIDRGALLMAPLNPALYGGPTTFRFRSARRFGYGTSPEMVRRCFERLDEAGITGDVRVLWALSDTHPVATQGPVWYFEGRPV